MKPNSINGFYSSIATTIDEINCSCSNTFMSGQFLQSVFSVIRKAHSQLVHLAESLKLPYGEKWLDEYMDDSSRIWEACLVLKLGLSRMQNYCSTGANLVAAIKHNPCQVTLAIAGCQRDAKALEEENKALIQSKNELQCLQINENVYGESMFYGFNGFRGVLHAIRILNSFLLRILLCGIVHCSNPTDMTFVETDITERFRFFGLDFRTSFEELHQRVLVDVERVEEKQGTLLHEFKKAKSCIEEMKRSTAYHHKVENLQELFLSLSCGTEELITQIDDFFDDIVDGRKKLLNICSNTYT